MHLEEQVKTSRRENYETYCRVILTRAGVDGVDLDTVLNEEQPSLEDRSVLQMIYGGEYVKALIWVEQFVDMLADLEGN